jgi:hypothetical protein
MISRTFEYSATERVQELARDHLTPSQYSTRPEEHHHTPNIVSVVINHGSIILMAP